MSYIQRSTISTTSSCLSDHEHVLRKLQHCPWLVQRVPWSMEHHLWYVENMFPNNERILYFVERLWKREQVVWNWKKMPWIIETSSIDSWKLIASAGLPKHILGCTYDHDYRSSCPFAIAHSSSMRILKNDFTPRSRARINQKVWGYSHFQTGCKGLDGYHVLGTC